MELDDAHVVVTGASRGIGAAMARRFARAGARLSLVARSGDALAGLADELDAAAFVADLLEPTQVDRLVPRIEESVDPIDVLVNNAGLAGTTWHNETDPARIRSIVQLNLEAPLVLTRAVLPGMLERRRGHLVYTSSLAGTGGFPGLATYGATKAGLMNFAAALRMELKDTPLRTTVVARRSASFWLREVPTRLTEAVLTGVPTGPR